MFEKIKEYLERKSNERFERKYKIFSYEIAEWHIDFIIARKPYRDKIIKKYELGIFSAALETIFMCEITSKASDVSERFEIVTAQYLHMNKEKLRLVKASTHFTEDDLKMPMIQGMIEHIRLNEERKQTAASLNF